MAERIHHNYEIVKAEGDDRPLVVPDMQSFSKLEETLYELVDPGHTRHQLLKSFIDTTGTAEGLQEGPLVLVDARNNKISIAGEFIASVYNMSSGSKTPVSPEIKNAKVPGFAAIAFNEKAEKYANTFLYQTNLLGGQSNCFALLSHSPNGRSMELVTLFDGLTLNEYSAINLLKTEQETKTHKGKTEALDL